MRNRLLLLTIAVISALTLLPAPASAQISRVVWPAFTGTGNSTAYGVRVNDKHTVAAVVTGAPSACTVTLQGTLDGTIWFDLSTAQTCTTNILFHVVDKPITSVRAAVLMTGGTTPTLTVTYIGLNSGGR